MADYPRLPAFEERDWEDAEIPVLHRLYEPFFQQVRAALERGLTVTDNFASWVSSPIQVEVPEVWRTLTGLPSGWTGDIGLGNQVAAWSRDDTGRVWLRGRLSFSGGAAPGAPVQLVPLPAGWQPSARETFLVYGTDAGGVALTTVLSITEVAGAWYLQWDLGGWRNISLAGLSFASASRLPEEWGSPFPLPVQAAFTPAMVWAVAQQVDAGRSPMGRAMLVPAEWKQDLRRQAGERFATTSTVVTRLPGLAPGQRYEVVLYALAG